MGNYLFKCMKLSENIKVSLIDTVLKLRYGPWASEQALSRRKLSLKSPALMHYSAIAKHLKVSYNTVQHICRYKPVQEHRKKYGGQQWKLDQEHVEFLVSEETLKQWAALTLKERAKLFHRKFPNKKIAPTSLRRLYLKHKVRRKAVR